MEGLDNVELGGNLSIEMVIVNYNRNIKSIYFTSIGEVENNGETINATAITARFNNSTKFLVRPDQVGNINYTPTNYRNVDESGETAITNDNEYHYIFCVEYVENVGSSLKIYINGVKEGENNANLQKQIINDVRNTNFIGTRKVETGATYLNGIVKYLKIYQNSMTDSEAESTYNNFTNSPYFSDISSGTNTDKYNRRHSQVNNFFTNNSSLTDFLILGNQLGLSKSSKNYKVHKFISGSEIEIEESYNYIPLSGQNQNIILKYNNIYFKITQTSESSDENSKYKLEVSTDNKVSYTLECSDKGFGSSYNYNNINFLFGGGRIFN